MAWPDDLSAATVEQSFAALLDRPGQQAEAPWRADVLRDGAMSRLGALVTLIAAEITERAAASAGFAAREAVAKATERLLEVGDLMRAQPEAAREPLDYHWIIIGELVAALASLTEPPDALFPHADDVLEW